MEHVYNFDFTKGEPILSSHVPSGLFQSFVMNKLLTSQNLGFALSQFIVSILLTCVPYIGVRSIFKISLCFISGREISYFNLNFKCNIFT